MTVQIISDVNFTDPSNLIPYLEKDEAVYRGITKALVDFSNPDSFPAGTIPSGNVANGQGIKSLTSDGSSGSTTTAFSAGFVNGLLDFQGASKIIALPSTFKLANTCRRFIAEVWVNLPGSGYQTASATISQGIVGVLGNTTTLAQWGFFLETVQATGLPNTFSCVTPVSGGVGSKFSLSNSDTLALCDGNTHLVTLLFDGETNPGNYTRSIYVDKVLKQSLSATWDNTFNVPADNPLMGRVAGNFQANVPANFKIGRPSILDLTGVTILKGVVYSNAQQTVKIMQDEADAASGYVF